MKTESLSTLKIHKLTQAQYDRELAAGNIDESALYLTPDEEIDLSSYATVNQLNEKANTNHIHDEYMSSTDPTGTGAFILNTGSLTIGQRKAGSTVGECSAVIGGFFLEQNTEASGDYSFAQGVDTVASGQYSFASGRGIIASGHSSHAEGEYCSASGNASHAEGNCATASGDYSHAEGKDSVASGHSSHAEGESASAIGRSSHAEGGYTNAYSEYQHVQGKWNIVDSQNNYAHIVGNGSFETASNAHTIDWDGNAWFQGDVYVGSTSGKNKDDGSNKLATEAYVNNKIAELMASLAEVQSHLGI